MVRTPPTALLTISGAAPPLFLLSLPRLMTLQLCDTVPLWPGKKGSGRGDACVTLLASSVFGVFSDSSYFGFCVPAPQWDRGACLKSLGRSGVSNISPCVCGSDDEKGHTGRGIHSVGSW